MTTIDFNHRAIQTRYHGCHFRSRLEARWAVFFDNLNIPWRYEPQGYTVGFPEGSDPWCARPYLPDFYLPDTQTWVEVKGSADAFDWQLLANAVDWGHGLPGTDDSVSSTRGLLLLGEIPWAEEYAPAHCILQHNKGGVANLANFDAEDQLRVSDFSGPEAGFDSTTSSGIGTSAEAVVRMVHPGESTLKAWGVRADRRVKVAYIAAKSARFEHGARG